jgi:hypothetical protein
MESEERRVRYCSGFGRSMPFRGTSNDSEIRKTTMGKLLVLGAIVLLIGLMWLWQSRRDRAAADSGAESHQPQQRASRVWQPDRHQWRVIWTYALAFLVSVDWNYLDPPMKSSTFIGFAVIAGALVIWRMEGQAHGDQR